MKIVTFNIRGDFGVDGANDFCHRKPLILKKLRQAQPDIVGFQEVLPHVADWMRAELPEYDVVGCGRETTLTGEQATIIFRQDKFTLIEMRTFWLSPTPLVPGSRYAEQSWCPRTATELLLLRNADGRVFRVINTHLDHEGTQARRLGLGQILRHIEDAAFFPDAPVILMGDFNATPDSEELRIFADHPGYVDATKGIGTTFHDFMRQADGPHIDYIFLRGFEQVDHQEKWEESALGVCLSDHYPICIEATI